MIHGILHESPEEKSDGAKFGDLLTQPAVPYIPFNELGNITSKRVQTARVM